MQTRLEKTSETFEIGGQFLFKGGEAAVFAVPGRDDLVAKVYHKPTPERAKKLTAMLAAPPTDPMAAHGHASIAWPVDRLLQAGDEAKCVGFVMPRVNNARPAFDFYNPRARLKQCPLFHFGYLLRTARNLAAAVRAVHERGYVIGDVNESNILVTNQALVTLVDTDSFQVPDGGTVHRCVVGKVEYTPPELQGARFADFDRLPEHDAFALGILVFQLLMQGMHPFNGVFTGHGDPAPLGKRIAAGYYPYAGSRPVPYEPNPHAPPLAVLPAPVRELLARCFEAGHDRPAARPTALQWQEALRAGEKLLTVCSVNRQHLYPAGLDGCPWCEMALRHGRDPFPTPEEVAARRSDSRPDLDRTTPVPGVGGRATLTARVLGRTTDTALPQVMPADGPNAVLDVLPAAPFVQPAARPRRPPGPFLQLLMNPAFWLITPAIIGLLVLVLAIVHARRAAQEPAPVPPILQPGEPPGDDAAPDG